MKRLSGRHLAVRFALLGAGLAVAVVGGCGETGEEPGADAGGDVAAIVDAGPPCSDGPACPCSPARQGLACDDGDPCSKGELCTGGVCGGGEIRVCVSSAPCFEGTCLPATGKCQFHAAPDGYWCDDGDICTHTDRCKTGHCLGEGLDCDDGNPCTAGSCAAGQGCSHSPIGVACEDGDICTSQDTCKEGVCTGLATDCHDGNACTTDACNGGCKNVPAVDGDDCGPGMTCTLGLCTNSCKPWGKVIGGKEPDGFLAVTAHDDGGWTAVGWTASKGAGQVDAWVVRFDSKWTISVDKAMGGKSEERWLDVAALGDGGDLLGGWTGSNGNGESDGWIARLDAKGKQLWQVWHGGKGFDRISGVVAGPNGGAIAVGTRDLGGNAKGQAWLLRLSATGALLSENTWGGEANDSFADVAVTQNMVVAAGLTFTSGPKGDGAGLVMGLDNQDKKMWELLIGGPKYEVATAVLYQNGGMFYDVGGSNDTISGDYDGLLSAFNNAGKVEWTKKFGTKADDRFEAVTFMGNGVVAVGYTDGGFGKAEQGWVARLDNSGKLIWQQTAGGPGQDRLQGVARTWDSGVVAVGVSTVGGDDTDGWVTRLDGLGQAQCN